jgi:glucose/mannose-6-phosphate isomerase
MYVTYDKWPKIAKESYTSTNEVGDFKNIDHLIFCGMGGSGTICDVFASILSRSDFHICVVKGYHLPSTIDSNTLVITSSVSGNTMETLQVLESANKSGCKTISFSGGGKMKEFCERNGLPFKKIPIFHSPRASLPSFLYAMIRYFSPMFNINKSDVLESIKSLENIHQKINSANLDSNNIALNLAKWMVGLPMIYYPWGLQAAAIRFKNSLQENAKMHAMAEDIMEASHNGIVAWETHSNIQPILIQGVDDHQKTKERWKIFEKYFHENEINFYKIQSINGNILSKLISLIYLLDYASIYKAVLNKIDPTPTNSIDYIKSKLD